MSSLSAAVRALDAPARVIDEWRHSCYEVVMLVIDALGARRTPVSTLIPVLSLGILICSTAVSVAQPTKYRVIASFDKKTDFTRINTYEWMASRPSSDKAIDRQVMAAVDRELAALGLVRVSARQSDVRVSYMSLTRTDVDLKGRPCRPGGSIKGSSRVPGRHPRRHPQGRGDRAGTLSRARRYANRVGPGEAQCDDRRSRHCNVRQVPNARRKETMSVGRS